MIVEKLMAKFAGNKIGDTVAKVMDSADKLFTSKEEKLKLQNDLQAELNRAIEAERASVLKEVELQLADTANARQREIELAKDEHTPLINKIITPILALIIVISTFSIWGMILFRHYEPKGSESMIIGALTTLCAGVVGYYFGSSSGSHAKSKQLDKLANK
jgi:uncharacterized membrane protein (DUF106 family)